MALISADPVIIKIEHDGYEFIIIRQAFENREDYFGYYFDRNGKYQRILKDSLYGQLIINIRSEIEDALKSRSNTKD